MERVRELISGMMDAFKCVFGCIRKHPIAIIISLIIIYLIFILIGVGIGKASVSKFENFIAGDSTRASKKETPWGEWTDWEGPRDMSGERCGTARRYRSRACLRQPCINRDGKQIDLEVDVKKMKPCDLQIGP